jgi:hypothetical protein
MQLVTSLLLLNAGAVATLADPPVGVLRRQAQGSVRSSRSPRATQKLLRRAKLR